MDGGAEYGCGLNLEATELRLGLPGSDVLDNSTTKSNKRAFSDAVSGVTIESVGDASESEGHETSPATKAQVVGWPPVRSYRKNNIHISSGTPKEKRSAETAGIYVKVSMDGAPYLRKIDLKPYNDYQDLLKALEKMFSCFIAGEFANRDGSDYVPTYEDKDGDWMLVGDVPWEMFISSCKRLRIMKGSDAKGLGSGSSHI